MYLYDESKIRIVSIGEEKEGSEVMECRASNLSIIGLFSLFFCCNAFKMDYYHSVLASVNVKGFLYQNEFARKEKNRNGASKK